jgi:hypothetical protein
MKKMKNMKEVDHAPDAPDGGGRIEYRAPQLIEFGHLAAHTQSSTPNGMGDSFGPNKTLP